MAPKRVSPEDFPTAPRPLAAGLADAPLVELPCIPSWLDVDRAALDGVERNPVFAARWLELKRTDQKRAVRKKPRLPLHFAVAVVIFGLFTLSAWASLLGGAAGQHARTLTSTRQWAVVLLICHALNVAFQFLQHPAVGGRFFSNNPFSDPRSRHYSTQEPYLTEVPLSGALLRQAQYAEDVYTGLKLVRPAMWYIAACTAILPCLFFPDYRVGIVAMIVIGSLIRALPRLILPAVQASTKQLCAQYLYRIAELQKEVWWKSGLSMSRLNYPAQDDEVPIADIYWNHMSVPRTPGRIALLLTLIVYPFYAFYCWDGFQTDGAHFVTGLMFVSCTGLILATPWRNLRDDTRFGIIYEGFLDEAIVLLRQLLLGQPVEAKEVAKVQDYVNRYVRAVAEGALPLPAQHESQADALTASPRGAADPA